MEVIVAKTAGFCFGVKRAIDIAKESILLNDNVYSIGSIVHNKFVNDELKDMGLKFVENISKCDMKAFVDNFKLNYNSVINETSETPAEKLAMLYLKQILGV